MLVVSTSGFAQFSLPFFKNEFKEKFENEREKNILLSEDNHSLTDSLRIISNSNRQLKATISQLELNNKKLTDRLDNHARENKRLYAQVVQLKKDTSMLNLQLRDISYQLAAVELEGKQRSARLEKQIYVLKDSLQINSTLYQHSHQELTKIQSLVSMIKIGDMEFNIPSDQFIKTLHSAILTGNSKVVLRTDYNGKAVLLYNTHLSKKRFIGHRQVPYRLEAYLSYFPHPYYSTDKTILAIRTRTFFTHKDSEEEVKDFGDKELLKTRFYEELERINYSYQTPASAPTLLTKSEGLKE
ncbi:hypothetical protein GCM10027275_17920 [Rhabdobacter roseus]